MNQKKYQGAARQAYGTGLRLGFALTTSIASILMSLVAIAMRHH